jgi:hypothetical protein
VRKSTAVMRYQVYSLHTSSAADAAPDTTPQLIALAVSLVGGGRKVMEQMRCSDADFFLYRSGQKELPLPELDRLVSLIIDEQQRAIAKRRESLTSIHSKRTSAQR